MKNSFAGESGRALPKFTSDAFFIGLFYLFIGAFFLFTAHYLQVNTAGTGLQMPFNALSWIPLSFIAGIAFLLIAKNKTIVYTELTVKLLVCLLLLSVPLFYPGADRDHVAGRMVGLWAGFLLLVSFQQFAFRKIDFQKVLLLLFAAIWIEAIVGWDEFLRSLGMLTSDTRPVWHSPIAGVFQQKNVMASFLATGFPLSAYLLGKMAEENKGSFQTAYIPLLLFPLASVHLLHALESRTGWLGMMVGVLLVLPWLWQKSGRRLSAIWLAALMAGFLLTNSIETNSEWQPLRTQIISVTSLRQTTFPQSLEMIWEKPWAGYGYGHFESAYLHFTADKYAAGEMESPGRAPLDHPHNELMFWWVEGGIVAFAGLMLAAWFVWKTLLKYPLDHRLALVGLLFPIVLHTQLEYPLYVSLTHWIALVLFIFWIDHGRAQYRTWRVDHILIFGICGVAMPVITSVFMATSIYTGLLLARFELGINPDVRALQKINNAVVWSDKLNWALRSRMVVNGIINDDPEQIRAYVQWAPELIKNKPRPTFYRYLILAYQHLGDQENMQKTKDEAYYLFPDQTFEVDEYSGLLVQVVPFEAISNP